MPKVSLTDFVGGLSLLDDESIKDNELSEITNFVYNDAQELETRKGYEKYGAVVPDGVVLISSAVVTTNWVASLDALNVTAGTAIRGVTSVNFDIDVSNDAGNVAKLTNASIGNKNITSYKGSLGLWFYVPSDFLTTSIIRLGSDSSNYYEWTAVLPNPGTNTFIQLLFSSATTVGAPVDTTINYFQWEMGYAVATTDKTGLKISDIYCYSPTSTKPITSIFNYDSHISDLNDLLIVVGNTLYQKATNYFTGDPDWAVIETGLTEFETKTGYTDQRTKFSFVGFYDATVGSAPGEPAVFYCNGVDYYRKWNRTKVVTYSAIPKCRYLYALGIANIFGSGADTHNNLIYYTDITKGGETLGYGYFINPEELGVVNGIAEYNSLPVFICSNGISQLNSVDFSTTASVASIKNAKLDVEGGGYSFRTMKTVTNKVLYLGDGLIKALQYRNNSSSSNGIDGFNIGDNIQVDTIGVKYINLNGACSVYDAKNTQYIISLPLGDTVIPTDTYCMNSGVTNNRGTKTNAWSKLTYPSIYDYTFFRHTDNTNILLGASANGGQVYKLNTGYQDNGVNISYSLTTKNYNQNDLTALKTYEYVDIIGSKSEGYYPTIEVLLDDEVYVSATLTDDFLQINSTNSISLLGDDVLGEGVLSGSETISDDLEQYPFLMRIPLFVSGRKIKLHIYSDNLQGALTFHKFQIKYDKEMEDIFPIDFIA